MATWGNILKEIKESNNSPFDVVRRKYLRKLYNHTKRNTVIYMTKWTQSGNTPPYLISMVEEDIQGFMEITHDLDGDSLDLILHSPGGFPHIAESLVKFLRERFKHIRVIIPQAAMSAATMMACAADEIVMGDHSFIGPIDPQVSTRTYSASAQAILEQFERARAEIIKDQNNLGVWMPIIQQYTPGLIIKCEKSIQLAEELVRSWLKDYMFKNDKPEEAKKKAVNIARWLSDHSLFKTHSRHISKKEAKDKGLRITDLEDDPTFYSLVLSVFNATTITFDGTSAVKIIENHNGDAFIKQHIVRKQ